MGNAEGGPVEEAVEDVEGLVAEAEELLGREFAGEDEARVAVEERLDEVAGEVEELEAQAARLDELASRLKVGMDARFRGTLDGFDSRKTYCGYCGQAVTKGEVGEVQELMAGEKERVEEDIEGLQEDLERLEELVPKSGEGLDR